MKKVLLFLTVAVLVSRLFAEPASPQDEIKTLKTTIEKQREELVYMRALLQDLKQSIQENAVPRGIRKNLHELQIAFRQYCIDHKVTECQFTDLVGPGKYLSPQTIPSYEGESYEALRFAMDAGEWRIDTSLGFAVIHKLPKFDPQEFKMLIEKTPNQALLPTPISVTRMALR